MSNTKFTVPEGYEVTKEGKVISNKYNWRGLGAREIKWSSDGTGYPIVRLTNSDGCRRKYKVHQLVCTKFHGPRPSELHEVRHLDGNPMNNSVGNLAWGTRSENAKDRVIHGTQFIPNWKDPSFREKAISGMRRYYDARK